MALFKIMSCNSSHKVLVILTMLLASVSCFAQSKNQFGLKVGTAYTAINKPEYIFLYSEQRFVLNEMVGLTYEVMLSKHMRLGIEGLIYLRNTFTDFSGFIPSAIASPG